jgi:hypothetical protein
MASTSEGRRLTETHRLAQARLRNRVAADLLRLWPVLDPADIDLTLPGWLRATVPVVVAGGAESQQLAAAYFRQFRFVELGELPQTLPPFTAVPAVQVETSLAVTGAHMLRRGIGRGEEFSVAVGRARVASAAAGARVALHSGRRYVAEAVLEDRAAVAWSRVTSSRPCGFCALMASRGFVYKSEQTADFHAHDSCGCTIEPAYRETGRSDSAARFARLYEEVLNDPDVAEADAAKVFRRRVEALQ